MKRASRTSGRLYRIRIRIRIGNYRGSEDIHIEERRGDVPEGCGSLWNRELRRVVRLAHRAVDDAYVEGECNGHDVLH